MTQEQLERRFTTVISYALNFVLAGGMFIALSIWGPA